ncbi:MULTISPECIES: 50S ribosomal protein L11 methyltransferase [unclassified Methylocaldum]|jgi:ribosomal protein L11 methyltransferase|uniref:50S ribosomal protein L11 methyltransferase n=1 Tax=unclassified Methylocaldum TaxID=2622260 RepID=UPI000A324660|nr:MULTISPECIES: 50S ribosomal protein L11 methyltransferase [unclassified Methylocaldum]MBP1151979.1 ribosomal protein L11 methyltransferase [Methylocaldum sp. RMAD-M]
MWRQLAITVDESLAEPVSDLLSNLGAVSVSFEDAGDQPLFEPKPGETPVWRQTKVIGLFDADANTNRIRNSVANQFGERVLQYQLEDLEDRVWERAWLDHFQPMRFGQRLWICPTGFEPPEPEAVNIVLDPGLAFGTGTHPTTALCLEWLDGQDLAGKTVIDYGCGSGVLAVAALKLGAAKAYGVDIDPQALTASDENARKNGVEDRLALGYPRELAAVRADVLVANILATPLIELAAEISEKVRPGGSLALSGILATQVENVRAAYASQFDFSPPVVREEWALLTGAKLRG